MRGFFFVQILETRHEHTHTKPTPTTHQRGRSRTHNRGRSGLFRNRCHRGHVRMGRRELGHGLWRALPDRKRWLHRGRVRPHAVEGLSREVPDHRAQTRLCDPQHPRRLHRVQVSHARRSRGHVATSRLTHAHTHALSRRDFMWERLTDNSSFGLSLFLTFTQERKP